MTWDTGPGGGRWDMVSSCLSNAQVREELRRFASSALRQELSDLRNQVRDDLRIAMLELLPRCNTPFSPKGAPLSFRSVASVHEADLPGQPDVPGHFDESDCTEDEGASPHFFTPTTTGQNWRKPSIGERPPTSPQPLVESRRLQVPGSDLSLSRTSDMETRFSPVRRLSVIKVNGVSVPITPKRNSLTSVEMFTTNHVDSDDDDDDDDPATTKTADNNLKDHMDTAKRRMTSFFRSFLHEGSLTSEGLEDPPTTCSTCIQRVEALVKSVTFDYVSGFFVLANTLLIGVQTDWQARNVTMDSPSSFRIFEVVFLLVFTLELVLRIVAFRWDFFGKAQVRWHVFDCILVGSQMAEFITAQMVNLGAIEDRSSGSNVSANFSGLRILRVLRLIRIMRLVRILRLIAELRTLVMSIMGSLKSLVWAICLLFIMMYAMGIYLTQMVLDHRLELAGLEGTSSPDDLELVKYFGSLGDTVLSVYKAVTGGVDWENLLDPLATRISVFLVPFFMFYIAFSTLCMLNVITGVFVESALLTAKEDKDTYMVNSARLLFDTYDRNRSGNMSRREFSQAVQSKEMQRVLAQLDIDVSEADVLFDLLDTRSAGRISAEDFITGCVRLRGPSKALELAILNKKTTFEYMCMKKANLRLEQQMKALEKALEKKTDALIGGRRNDHSFGEFDGRRTGSSWCDFEEV